MTTAPDTTDAAFLAAILANPLDDAPRLVYADWLDETGRVERAEYIRVQCELARFPPPGLENRLPGPTRQEMRESLRRREADLWNSPGAIDWFNPYAAGLQTIRLPRQTIGHIEPVGYVRRGFIDSASLPTAALVGGPCGLCGGEGQVRHGPVTRRVVCPDCKGNRTVVGIAARLARCPLTEVRLSDRSPGHHPTSGLCGWYLRSPREGVPAATAEDLPADLFALLSPGVEPGWRRRRWYPSEGAAVAALFAACLEYVRRAGQKATARPKSLLQDVGRRLGQEP